jgi:hypothetical protein
LILCSLGSSRTAHADFDTCDVVTTHVGQGPARTVETWSGGGESLLFVGEGAVLSIHDISNPAAPVRVGEVGLSGPAWNIAISADGELAAVSDRRSTVRLVDISVRSTPQEVGSYVVPEGRIPYGVELSGNRLYAAIVPAGLAVIDVATPTTPTLLAQVVTTNTDFVFDVVVRNNFAYVADDAEGVTVWNVSNPSAPTAAGTYAAASGASHLFVNGTRLYVARRNQGYDVLSLAAPASPTLIGSIPDVGSYSHGAIVNGRLAVATGPAGMRIYNIGSATPQLVATVPDDANFVAGLGNNAWANTPSGVRRINLATPSAPVASNAIALSGASERVHVAHDRIYVPQFPTGMAILGNSALDRGALLGRYADLGVSQVTSVGNLVVVSRVQNDVSSLRVLDASNPAAVTELGSLPLATPVYQFASQGTLLYAATPDALLIVDLSNPATPTVAGSWTPPSGAVIAVIVNGNRAYVGGGSTLWVLNISNPISPALLGQYSVGDPVLDLQRSGNHVFVADGTQWLKSLNVANPAAITESDALDLFPGLARAVALDGTRLYTAAGPLLGTVGVDVSNPTSLQWLENFAPQDDVLDVAMGSDSLVTAEGRNGVRIFACVTVPPSPNAIFEDGFEGSP